MSDVAEPPLDREGWRRRIAAYYGHYNPRMTIRKLLNIVDMVVEDQRIWQTILCKYGPELDPPFEQPNKMAMKHMKQRQFLSAGDAAQYWKRRFQRFYAHYNPDRSIEDIERFVDTIPSQDYEAVWHMAIEKYGPEPQGDPTKRQGDGLSLTSTEVQEFEGREITIVKQHDIDAAVVAQQRTDRIEREKMKIRIAQYRTATGKDARWETVDALVEAQEMRAVYDLWTKEIEEEHDGSSIPKSSDIERTYWRQLLIAYQPELDPFDAEDIIDQYAARAGGVGELLATLEVKEEEGLHQHLAAAAARKRLQQDEKKDGSYRLFHDLTPRQFWYSRLQAYYSFYRIEKTSKELEDVVDRFMSMHAASLWDALTMKYGAEPAHLTEEMKQHREFWHHHCQQYLAAVAPQVTSVELKQLFDACNRNWPSVLDHLKKRFGSADTATEGALSPIQRLSMPTVEPVEPSQLQGKDFSERKRQEERQAWFDKIMAYMKHYNPSAANRARVNAILDKSEDMKGGWAMAWSLLLVKYGPEPVSSPKSERSEKSESQKHPKTTEQQELIAAVSNQPPRSSKIKVPSMAEIPQLMKNNRPYYFRKIQEYCRVKKIQKTDLEIDVALEKYAHRPGGYCALWHDLQKQYGHYDDGIQDKNFWRFVLGKYIAAKELTLPVDHLQNPKGEFERLQQTFGQLPDHNIERLREEFVACQAQRQEPGQLASTYELKVPKEYWLHKMNAYREVHCPGLDAEVVTTLLEAGEVSGTPMERLWIEFVHLCSVTTSVKKQQNPLNTVM